MSRKTAQLFDLMFKCIIKDASASAIVHLINGIYKKDYPLNTPIKIEPNELIKRNMKSGKLEKIISDIIITIDNKDTYFIEAQIDDDLDMSIRVFNYSVQIALEKKTFENGTLQIEMPSPAVIYWETSKTKDVESIRIKFPNNRTVMYRVPTIKVLQYSVSELEGIALLLPFYILKIRKELKRVGTNSEKRKELSKELEYYIIEISKVLNICKENNYITESDMAKLLHRLSDMNSELYGKYKEFTEVNMRFKHLVDTGVDAAIEKAKKEEKSFTAKAMKAGGEAIDKIMRYTGLSRREIMAL